MAADISVRNVTKRFGERQALRDVSLDVPQGAFVTLLGPSGCGKTTLLRVIGGFEQPDAGTVTIRGQTMAGQPPHRRPTAMVFQRYALFPHMTVAENIAFGLKMQGRSGRDQSGQVSGMLELVDLVGYEGQYPDALSGGQQQRVALARALVVTPAVLLLDEPLGALDMSLRRQMQGELKSIQQQTGVTFVSVTHDQEEALAMSDQVVVMNAGRVEQVASPAGVFDQPVTRFVAEFMGSQVFEVPVLARSAAGAQVRFGGGDLTVPGPVEGETVTVAIRPERVRLAADGGWSAVVRDRVFKGAVMSLGLELADGSDLRCDVPHDAVPAMPKVGESLSVAIRPEDVWVIPGGSRVRANA